MAVADEVTSVLGVGHRLAMALALLGGMLGEEGTRGIGVKPVHETKTSDMATGGAVLHERNTVTCIAASGESGGSIPPLST